MLPGCNISGIQFLIIVLSDFMLLSGQIAGK